MIACLSLVTLCETPIPAAIEAAAQGGFSHVDLWWPALRQHLQQSGPDNILQALAEKKMAVASVSGFGLELAGSADLWRESLAGSLDFFKAIEPFSPTLLNFTSGLTHESPHAGLYATAIERLLELLSNLSNPALTLAMEFRSDSRWITSLETAVAVIAQVGNSRLGLCLDLFHFMTGPSKLSDISELTTGLIRSVHCSDLIATPRELARDSDRILPGEGDFDVPGILEQLADFNYGGIVSVDVPNPQLWGVAADRVADMAAQALARVWPETTQPTTETA
jgi:sugar phosphate isomerase/epimerase